MCNRACPFKYSRTIHHAPRLIYQPFCGSHGAKGSHQCIKGGEKTTKRFGVNCLSVQRSWQQVVKSSPACQGCLQSIVTEPTYLPLHHSSIGTEPSTGPLLIIFFKSSMTGCSTTMTRVPESILHTYVARITQQRNY